jgi:hypothetical protein
VLGAVGLIAGASTTLEHGWGVVLASATISTLVVLALGSRDLYLLAVSAVGTLLMLPPVMGRYFPGALTPALALLGVGVLLVVAAVVTTRRRVESEHEERPRLTVGSRRSGLLVAAVVLAATATTIIIASVR